MNKIYFKVIMLIFLSGCLPRSNLDYYGLETNTFLSGETQLWGRAWSSEIKYDDVDDTYIPECDNILAANKSSACIQKLNIKNRGVLYPAADIYAYQKFIPNDERKIDYALIQVKLKAWAMEHKSYCQITAKFAQEENLLDDANYLNHAEVFGGENWKLAGRDISYIVIPVPVKKDYIYLKVNREVVGKCEVSIAINVLGYYFGR